MKHNWRCGARFAALAGLLVLNAMVSLSLAAQSSHDTPLSSASTGKPLVVQLEYQEVEYSVYSWGISVQSQAAPFTKEPEVAGRKVKRGRMDFTPGRGAAVGFIWDPEQAKLYLDLNGNGDLTDDTNGVFTTAGGKKPGDRPSQEFRDTRLQLPSWPRPVLLDLFLNQYSSLYASAMLRSFCAGKVTLAGQDWQVGIVEKPHAGPGRLEEASLLLRPWADRTKSFGIERGDLLAFGLPKELFFKGVQYRLTPTWETEGGNRSCRIELAEQLIQLGDLKIAGEYISRAWLKDANRTVVLDAPAGTVQVPTGNYSSFNVHLRNDGQGASLKDDYWRRGLTRTIAVEAGKPAQLIAGGPLTNSVTLKRRGSLLVLDYRLVGAGGDAYELDSQDRSKPPTFAIYRGDKQLATGKFEFG